MTWEGGCSGEKCLLTNFGLKFAKLIQCFSPLPWALIMYCQQVINARNGSKCRIRFVQLSRIRCAAVRCGTEPGADDPHSMFSTSISSVLLVRFIPVYSHNTNTCPVRARIEIHAWRLNVIVCTRQVLLVKV